MATFFHAAVNTAIDERKSESSVGRITVSKKRKLQSTVGFKLLLLKKRKLKRYSRF